MNSDAACFTAAGRRHTSPDDGRTYGDPGTVVLDATGIDTEDGVMDSTALVWTSDIDGQLAATGVAVIDTAALTAGTHVLTATATDSDDTTGTATVTVTIKAASDPPAAADDVAYGSAPAVFAVDVSANDTDTEDDINPNSVRVVVPAALATAAAAGRGIIEYRATGAGYDVLVYEVCDRARQCDTAEVAIIAADRR